MPRGLAPRLFTNHFNLIVNLLKEIFGDRSIGIFWSNVVKIGKANDKGLPPDYILDATMKEFNVLQEEIKLINPDIIIFLSGPNYDKYIIFKLKN
jgi:ABC-type Fe3+-hydroxamate transport system substrate-binding protein